jgi:hypothetical protein
MDHKSTGTGRTRASRRTALQPSLIIFAAGLGAFVHSSPAAADTLFAIIVVTNATTGGPGGVGTPLTIKASTPQVFGFGPNASFGPANSPGVFGVFLPNGSAPAMIMPGQTIVFGTKSNGGLLATTGTGGSATIPEENFSINWSVPWAAFNGVGWTGCNGAPNKVSGSVFVTLGGVSGGFASSDGSGTCVFTFVAK